MKRYIYNIMAILNYLAVLLTALAVECKLIYTLDVNSFKLGTPQSYDTGGSGLPSAKDTNNDAVQKNHKIEATGLQEHGKLTRSPIDGETKNDQKISDIEIQEAHPIPENYKVSPDLIANYFWYSYFFDQFTNLRTWTLRLKRTEMVRTIFFKKKSSSSEVMASTMVLFKVGNSTESQQNPICLSGDAENPIQTCGLSGSYLNLIAQQTFFQNYDLMAFTNDVYQLDVLLDEMSLTTLLTLPAPLVVKEVKLFSSTENPSKNLLLIKSFRQHIEVCNLVEGPKNEKGLKFEGNQITVHTDRPFKPQAIMTFINCDCFTGLTQAEITFKDAYVGGQVQFISLNDHSIMLDQAVTRCSQRRIKFTNKITGLQILKWPFYGLSFDESFWQLRLNPKYKMDIGNHTLKLTILIDELVTKDVEITFKVKSGHNRLLQSQGNCNVATGLATLFDSTTIATQSDFGGGSTNSAAGCDGVTLWDYQNALAIQTTSTGPINFWRAQLASQKSVRSILYINQDGNPGQYYFSIGNNPAVDLNPKCNTGLIIPDGGWYPCLGSGGTYFGIWSAQSAVQFVEVQIFSQYILQTRANSAVINVPDTTYPANRMLSSNLILYQATGRNNLCAISASIPLGQYGKFTMELNAQVKIDSIVILCGETHPTHSWKTRCTDPVRVSVENVQNTQTACGADLTNYQNYAEAPCNQYGNKIIVEKTASQQKMFMCGIAVLSFCLCNLSSMQVVNMPLYTNYLTTQTSLSAQIGVQASAINVINPNFHDTVSRVCGNGDGTTYCGPRTVTVTRGDGSNLPITMTAWKGVTFDQAAMQMRLFPTSVSDVGTHSAVVTIVLDNFQSVQASKTISIIVTNVITACQELDSTNSNLLVSQTMASQSGFVATFNANAGVGCNTQIATGTATNFVVASLSPEGSFWTADLITPILIQTALVVIDESFISRISQSKLRVGSDYFNPSNNQACNEQMTAGGWWACGLTGQYFFIHSSTVQVSFTEIMLFSQHSIQANAKEALSSGSDPLFSVANSLTNIVVTTTTVTNKCQKTNLIADPSFQYTLNAPIVVQTLILVPSVDSSWASFQRDVTMCVRNSFTNTEYCNPATTGDYSSNYKQWKMNFEGNIIVVKKTGLNIVGFCSLGILSQCNCDASSFDLAKMPKFVIKSNTLVGPVTLNSTIGDAEKSIEILMQDTVSQVCGKADGTFCGTKVISFIDQTSGAVIYSWPYRGLTWDQAASLLRFKPISFLDVGSFIVQVTVSLLNYPAASFSTQISVVISVNQAIEVCSTAKITTTSDLEFKVFLNYFKDAAKSLTVPQVSDTQSALQGKSLACGPYEYTASKGVEKIISYDSSKQTVTFVTDNPDATSGTFELTLSVGLKNWRTASPIIFKFSYTIEKCQVTSITPEVDKITAIITIGDSPVSFNVPNWVAKPDCGYQPQDYKIVGDTSFVTQQPSQSDKNIKLGSNDTTIDLALQSQLSVSPVYSSSVSPQLPSTIPPIIIEISFSVKEDPTNNATIVTTYIGPNVNLTKNKTVKELPPANVTFGKIDNKGNMTIKFSREVVMPTFDIKEMTKILFDPAMGSSPQDRDKRGGSISVKKTQTKLANLEFKIDFDDTQQAKTEYKFEVSNITNSSIAVKGIFSDPIQVSQGFVADKLVITVNNFEIFHSADLKKVTVSQQKITMILPQLQVQATAFVGDVATQASQSTQMVFIILFVAKGFMDVGFSALTDQMRALTFVVHLMCAGLMYPEVMMSFFGPLLSFLLIDIIPLSDWLQQGFHWEITPLTPNFDAIGYNSGYILYNLGSLSMILLLTPILALILKPLHKSRCLHPKIRAFLTGKYEGLVWNGLINTVESNYFILLLCVLINIKTLDGNWGNNMLLNNIFGILSFLVVVGFPVVLFGLTWKYYDKLMDEQSAARKKFGQHMSSYHKTRNSKTVVMASKFGVYFKAIMLCLAFVFLTEHPWAVIAINNFTTLYDIMFTVYFKPHEEPKENFFQVKASIVLMLFNYHMQMLTPFVSDPIMRFYIGCSACSVVAFDLLLAVIFWAKDTYPKIKRYFQKKFVYEPALRKLKEEKLTKLLKKIKEQNEIEDGEALGNLARANQVRDFRGSRTERLKKIVTRNQQGRQQVLEIIEEKFSESQASSLSQSYLDSIEVLVRLRGGIETDRMEVRMVKVAAEIELIREKGMADVEIFTRDKLKDLGNLLPDDFETRSPRTRQILVEDLLTVFELNRVQPILHSVQTQAATKVQELKNSGVSCEIVSFRSNDGQDKIRAGNYMLSAQDVFESSSQIIKDYKEKEQAQEVQILKNFYRRGRSGQSQIDKL